MMLLLAGLCEERSMSTAKLGSLVGVFGDQQSWPSSICKGANYHWY